MGKLGDSRACKWVAHRLREAYTCFISLIYKMNWLHVLKNQISHITLGF